MNDLALHTRQFSPIAREMAYTPPSAVREIDLSELLARHGGAPFEAKQLDLVFGREAGHQKRRTTKPIWCAGHLDSLQAPAVAIVGTRKVSPAGAARARKLARGLATSGVAVVSGLAEGVDTEALTEAMTVGGRVAAVIGTPIDKAYPAKNAALQETIYRDHLLISQFPVGTRTFRSHFPERNRLMAAISDATVVIEASDTSGTLHQSAECMKLGRWLFIAKSVVEDRGLSWPAKFLPYEKTVVLERVEDVLERLNS
ncbi:DNA-processing protein DprA [Sphingomonas piscis]|nr:DNA-processing protein DprA [Sphingomonas piscis]